MPVTCPIWGTPAIPLSGYDSRDGVAIDSVRAGGNYFISRTAEVVLHNSNDLLRAKLSLEIARHNFVGSVPEILSTTIAEIEKGGNPRPDERAAMLLKYLVKESDHLGHELKGFSIGDTQTSDRFVYFGTKVGPKAAGLFGWSGSTESDEVKFLLEMLTERGAIRLGNENPIPQITVLPRGYEQVSAAALDIQSDQAFVAMWFDNSMLDAYEHGIELAVRSAGYRPMRIDRKEHVNKIDDEIIAEIRRSRFLIADFTSKPNNPRGGVYFEAGFALALGKPVIWTCRQDVIDHVHFDTRQFNHIVWASPEELAERLKNRIGAVIGSGPLMGVDS